ncbi:MAG: transcriptional regulator [Rhodocyclaceae bacterium]|nr:transcriptional regulator [Rhodocyclaceae bacterium]
MSLALEKRILLTIVTEAVVEQSLLADFARLGVRGYTVTDARGLGSHGLRDAAWDEAASIRIEIICDRNLADALLALLREHYYANYAMINFLHEVEISRPEKF